MKVRLDKYRYITMMHLKIRGKCCLKVENCGSLQSGARSTDRGSKDQDGDAMGI